MKYLNLNFKNIFITRGAGKSLILALGLGLASLAVQAQTAIRNISTSIQSGIEVLRVDMTQPIATAPASFSIQSPARIVLDFPGVSASAIAPMLDFGGQGNLRSVNIAQANNRTRLVLNLKQLATYRLQAQGNTLLVLLNQAPPVQIGSAPVANFAENLNRDTLPLKDVDFKRSPNGAGRLVVDLPNNQVGVDIRQQGKNLVVEFLKSSIPEGMRRRLDVSDFGTPIQNITASQAGDKVRMVIEPKGVWEHSAYQSDNQFVVEVRPQKIDPNKLTSGTGYNGEKLSLNFQNIEVRSLLQVIADFTNFNVVTSDTVNGSITLRLKDVPWDQALEIIMQARGLGVKKSGSVLWIAPKEELATKEKQDLEALQAIQNLEPLRTQSFQLNYAKAADIKEQLLATRSGDDGRGRGNGILSSRGSVVSEPRTNQLFVSDISSRLEQVREMIAKLDVPIRQVLIEARIVEAEDSFGKSLGVRWGGSDLGTIRGGVAGDAIGSGTGGRRRVALGGSYDAVSMTTGETENALDTLNTTAVNLAAIGQGGYNPASIGISLFNSMAGRFLNLEISALEAEGKGKIVASPRIVTADQTKALIEQGNEFPYQVATSSGATSLAFRKANLRLEVTPQITPEGNIILDLDVNKDSRGETTAQGIAINTKHVKTQVLVENGGTVVIGGIFEITETDNVTKVPLLGDIPIIGNAFKARARTASKKELLVFITPKVITDQLSIR